MVAGAIGREHTASWDGHGELIHTPHLVFQLSNMIDTPLPPDRLNLTKNPLVPNQ